MSHVKDLRISLKIGERLIAGIAALIFLVQILSGVAIFGYAIFRIPEHKGTNAIACGLCVFLSFFLALILIELCRPTTPTEDPDQTV